MTFAETLSKLRKQAGISRYRLALDSTIDGVYLKRLEEGVKTNPTRDSVIKLGLGLVNNSDKIEIHHVNELLLAADYAPLRGRGEQLPAPV